MVDDMTDPESFFMKMWGDEKHHIHCQAVIDACIGMAAGTTLDKNVFLVAGWLHDLGKMKDDENHHVASLEFLDDYLKEAPSFEPLRETIIDCITNHRSNGAPKTLYGRIFQLADKVALLDTRWLAFKK